VKLRGAVAVAPGAKTAVLGKATNPPTEATTATLLGQLPAGGAGKHGAAARAAAAKQTKLGGGKTKIASGKSAPIVVKLNAATRVALRRGAKVKATAKIVASGPGGTKTLTRSVTLEGAKKGRH